MFRRTCDFCFQNAPNLFRCAKCKRRFYCSAVCQKADWEEFGNGQSHKVFCLENDEMCLNGVDYLFQIDKQGVFALKPIRKGTSVSIERGLIPKEDCKIVPLSLNCTSEACTASSPFALQLTHSCTPNLCQNWIFCYGVQHFFAERDIEAGEELTIQFEMWNDFTIPKEKRLDAMKKFKSFSGHRCPAYCLCSSKYHQNLVEEAYALYNDKMIPARSVDEFEYYLPRLLEIMKKVQSTTIFYSVVYHRGFIIYTNHKQFLWYKEYPYTPQIKAGLILRYKAHSLNYQTFLKLEQSCRDQRMEFLKERMARRRQFYQQQVLNAEIIELTESTDDRVL